MQSRKVEKAKDRLEVIENIKRNLHEDKLNNKVEIGDPVIDNDVMKQKVLKYDILKKSPINKIKNKMARKIIDNYVDLFNKNTEIDGIENIENIKTGAIITSNHFSPQDSTPIIYCIKKLGKYKEFHIVITESNLAMEGEFGFIMNNFNTIPLSKNREYTEKKFMPTLQTLFDKSNFVLIYPEQEMWFNYRKVRNLKPGAYHLAARFKVPIIPCFVEMREIEGEYEGNGFNKLKYILHIMPPIYPDKNLSLKENKDIMRRKDYELKKEAYEKAYNKEMTYDFHDEDIAGFKETNKEYSVK